MNTAFLRIIKLSLPVFFFYGMAFYTPAANSQQEDSVRVKGLSQAESLQRLLEKNAELKEENNNLREELRESEIKMEAYVRRIKSLNGALSDLREENVQFEEQLATREEEFEEKLMEEQRRNREIAQEVQKLEKHLEEETYKQQWEQVVEKLEISESALEEISSERQFLLIREAKMHYNLGVLFFQDGEYEKADAEFTLALKHLPDDPDIYYNLAVLKDYYLEEPGKAAKYYRKYLDLSISPERELEIKKRISVNELRRKIGVLGR